MESNWSHHHRWLLWDIAQSHQSHHSGIVNMSLLRLLVPVKRVIDYNARIRVKSDKVTL